MQDTAIKLEQNPRSGTRRAVRMEGARMGQRVASDFGACDYGGLYAPREPALRLVLSDWFASPFSTGAVGGRRSDCPWREHHSVSWTICNLGNGRS